MTDLVPGEGEGLAHRELVVLVLLVKAEGEAENVGVPMRRRPASRELLESWRLTSPVVEHVTGRHSLPPRSGNVQVKSSKCPWRAICWMKVYKSLLVISDENSSSI